MRELKYHEKKLLKKVDFLNWKKERNFQETRVMRKYHIQSREDYARYNKIAGMVTKLVAKLKSLKPSDVFRVKRSQQLLKKLHDLGLIAQGQALNECDRLSTSEFCKRRLPVVLMRLKFAETMREAVTFVEHGHIRVGVDTVTDPAFHVSRAAEDYIDWVRTSSVRRSVLRHNDKLDDYELMD